MKDHDDFDEIFNIRHSSEGTPELNQFERNAKNLYPAERLKEKCLKAVLPLKNIVNGGQLRIRLSVLDAQGVRFLGAYLLGKLLLRKSGSVL